MDSSQAASFPTTAYRPEISTGDAERTVLSAGTEAGVVKPEIIPGYEMVKEIGRGGMGVVYLARQQSLNRLVALKMILAGNHASSSDLLRFKTEAEAIAQLQHPHIVQVIETGECQGNPWFSMEYVAGGSLDKRMQGRPLPAREAARVTSMLAEAVAHAHARGVLHRDLKPGNILVQDVDGQPSTVDSTQKPVRTTPGRGNTVVLDSVKEVNEGTVGQSLVTLKVTDFGLAKQLDDARTWTGAKTQAGTVMGSPSYMAPEQAAGDNTQVGPTVDVYALGAILYELLTGRPPFRASTSWDTIVQVLNDEPVAPTRLMPRLPKDIETICLKCLSKDAKKRYGTVAELDADLQRFLQDEPIQARPVAWWERTWKAAKRRPTLAGLVLTALLAVGTIIALIAIGNARLQIERDNAQTERDRAMVAMKKAESEQKKAQKRLEKAVEAVEKLLTRTASENWARRPELQEERKKLLEEAVAFYQSFLEQESEDPLLRREAARVYYRMAGVYLLLGDSVNAQEVLKKTKALQDALCTDFPENLDYKHDLIKTESFLASAVMMQGEMTTSFNMHEKAAKHAEALAQAFPENVEFKITQVRSYLNLSYYYLNSNPKTASYYIEKARNLGKEIYQADSKPYANQLAYLSPLVDAANYYLNLNNQKEVRKLLEEIQPVLAKLETESAPSVQDRDQYETLHAKYVIINGYAMVRSGNHEAGENELRRGVALLDTMLSQRPKMYPVRMLQMNALQTLGDVQDRQQKLVESKKTIERSFNLQDQMIRELPQLKYLKNSSTRQRSMMLVMRARDGAIKGYERSAEDFLKTTKAQDDLDAVYNVACGYAQAYQHADSESKDKYAKRSLALLEELFQKNYFTTPRILHLVIDPDIAPLRNRDDFKLFMKRFDTTKKSAFQFGKYEYVTFGVDQPE
ncbi:MAG: protein kinase [Planctomycetia bacterium]|nr:protein kinase [Planctomycetia bacterium]